MQEMDEYRSVCTVSLAGMGPCMGICGSNIEGSSGGEEKGVGVGGRDGRGCGGMDMVEGKSSFLVLSESLPGLGMKSRFRGGGGGGGGGVVLSD